MKRIVSSISCLLFTAAILMSCGVGEAEAGREAATDSLTDMEPVEIETPAPVIIERLDSLTIYYPQFSRIDLVCGTRPSQSDESVIFMAEAAFTGERLKEFRHSNIAGDHVSGGKREKGYNCRRNNGAFVWYDGNPKFLCASYSNDMDRAARKGGCGFAQEMMIHKGGIVKHTRPANNVNEFRALCLIDGKVAVADSNGYMRFGDFIDELLAAGVTEALYLDMGMGWNYSWYRDSAGTPIEIHSIPTKYATNWITFYR